MSWARSVLYGSAPYDLSLWGPAPARPAFALDAIRLGDAARGAELRAGTFHFAGERVCGETPPWTAALRPAFLAELHGFAWLADLAALDDAEAWTAARAWTEDWLARCDGWDILAWRADVAGTRLIAWITYWPQLAGRAEADGFTRRLCASLARQMRHLARVGRREAPGVKRLTALAGLIAAAAALGNPGMLERGLRQLASEAEAQILPDGGHVERSPRAQLLALKALIAARAALVARQTEVPPALQSAIDRAAPMLRFFRHGDGALALFNGAKEDAAETIERVLARAEAKGRAPQSAPHAGFQRLQAGRSLAIVDAGAPPPPGLDGDAHAGTLSFEMSHGRERLIVNCGAYQGPSAQ